MSSKRIISHAVDRLTTALGKLVDAARAVVEADGNLQEVAKTNQLFGGDTRPDKKRNATSAVPAEDEVRNHDLTPKDKRK